MSLEQIRSPDAPLPWLTRICDWTTVPSERVPHRRALLAQAPARLFNCLVIVAALLAFHPAGSHGWPAPGIRLAAKHQTVAMTAWHVRVPAAGDDSCTAAARFPNPGDGGEQTITVRTTADASVTIAVHYKTTTHTFTAAADPGGLAALTFSMGRPTPGYTVMVDVLTDIGQSCGTQFTPA
jgi:hypothetical protein